MMDKALWARDPTVDFLSDKLSECPRKICGLGRGMLYSGKLGPVDEKAT